MPLPSIKFLKNKKIRINRIKINKNLDNNHQFLIGYDNVTECICITNENDLEMIASIKQRIAPLQSQSFAMGKKFLRIFKT